MRRACSEAFRVPAILSLFLFLSSAHADESPVGAGKAVYNSYCILCHGDQGDGKGLMGIVSRAQQNGLVIDVYPRDFTPAVFKFRSTRSGDLPTDEDLLRTIVEGIPRSGMPSHKELDQEQLKAVLAYIKTFSERWERENLAEPLDFPPAPSYVGTAKSAERGKELWGGGEMGMACHKCHGDSGKGDGTSAPALKDSWGDRILPFDFTSGAMKGGSTVEDIYRTFVTGLDGTPMPSYEESLSEQERWDLVSYCVKLTEGE